MRRFKNFRIISEDMDIAGNKQFPKELYIKCSFFFVYF